MKIRTSKQASRQIANAKGLLPFVATAAIAGGVDAGFSGKALAAPVEVTYNNTIYSLESSTCLAQGTNSNFCNGATDFRSSSWFGNSELAKNLSQATKDLLGLDNPATGTNLGANFAWESQDPAGNFNPTSLVFSGFEWDPVLDNSYGGGGLWNSVTGQATRTIYLAKETAPPKPVAAAGPILASNNGLNINTTASLAAKTLLPQFEGGTLAVSAANTTVTDNFTLNGSTTNAIDANGNSSTFSGVFSDKTGSKGNIVFKNTGTAPATATLTSASTYGGMTGIFQDTSLKIGAENALPATTELTILGNGNLTLESYDQAVSALRAGGTINLGSKTLTLNGSSSGLSQIVSGAGISGIGSLIKDGAFTQDLIGTLTYTGTTTVKGGTLLINGTSTSSTTVNSGATLGGTGVITGNVTNSGTVSPGNSIGTLTINGNYTQNSSGTLALEVGGGGNGDLLQINGGRVTDLAGRVLISSAPGTSITAGLVYTGIATSPGVKYPGKATAKAAFGTITGDAGYKFVREDDPSFTELNNGRATQDRTKLQFGWLQLRAPVEGEKIEQAVIIPSQTLTGTDTIEQVEQQGGAITQVASAPLQFVTETCTQNTGNRAGCKPLVGTSNIPGPSSVNPNSLPVAKAIDAGKASIDSGLTPVIVNNPVTSQPQVIKPNANSKQRITTTQKPTVTPYGSEAFKFEITTDGATQRAVVSEEPQTVKNSDGTYTTTFAASGGQDVKGTNGQSTGINTTQLSLAGVNSDFLNIYTALISIPTRSELNQALHSITAEPYASMQSVALEAMEQFRQNSLALSDGDRAIRLFTEAEVCRSEDGSLIPADSSQRPSDCQPRKLSQASRWSLLIDATNTQAGLEGTNDLASLDYNIFQSTYGLQYDASKQWSIGAAFGYGQANLYNYEYANSSISSDTYGGSLWGIYRPSNPWKLTGLIGYTNFQYNSNRNINFGGLDRNATASWSGNGFTTALEAEYDWILSANKADRNAIRLKPNTYVAYSLHSQGDITESGAQSLNLAVDSHTADSLVYGIGFTLETPIQVASSTRLIPRLSVGYEHDFNADTNEEHQLTASFADVPALGSLDVLGQNRGANDLNVALNVELETSDQFSLYAGVGGSFWSNGNELNYGGGLRWRFGGAPKAVIAKAQPQPPAPVEPAPAPTPQPQIIRGLW